MVLSNKKLIKDSLGLSAHEVICDNPYFQRKTTTQEGCQIDYLIQTQFNTLYIAEIKFSKNIINTEIIDEMQQKITKLSIPKHFSYRPVLIHCGMVSDAVVESGFFFKIIDFSEFV